jgi:hypothetical protein
MRPIVACALLCGIVIYVALSIWPHDAEARPIALIGVVVFTLLFVAEWRRGRYGRGG